MKNRFDGALRMSNEELIDLYPADAPLNVAAAVEVKKTVEGKNLRILELGIGDGNLTRRLFVYSPEIEVDGLDISPEMIESAKVNLTGKKVNFICQDALSYLKEFNGSYDIIASSSTIHNFLWKDKLELFKEIYAKLNFSGKLILMDKVYPDDKNEQNLFHILQNKRYLNCLDKELAKEMIHHFYEDIQDKYRMEETQLIGVLKKIGFTNIRIVDRIEAGVLLVAEK